MRNLERLMAAAILALFASPALAGPDCGDSAAGFEEWLPDMKQEAVLAGVAPVVVDQVLDSVAYDPDVIAHDRRQGGFSGNVAAFAAKRVTP